MPTCAAVGWWAGEPRRAWPSRSGSCCAAGEPLIYAYYDGVDKIAHERGFGPYYEAELRSADDIVEQVRAQLIDGRRCWSRPITARSMSGPTPATLADDVLKLTRFLSGEGRFRWLHARPGADG